MATVAQLPPGKALTARGALGNPNTAPNYAIGVGKTAERAGRSGGSRTTRSAR